jgi:hypothetical protein
MQQNNAELVENLSAHFPLRNDASYAWGNVIGGFLLIPYLRALWSCGSIDEVFRVVDVSGQGRILTYPTLPRCPAPMEYGLVPYLTFVAASSQALYRPREPGFDFPGGMTMWTWIKFHTESTGVAVDYFTKWEALGGGWDNLSFMLSKTNGNVFNFNISDDGLSPFHTVSAIAADYEIDKWCFIAGRFTPSTKLDLFIGKATTGIYTWYTNIAGIPASIYIGKAPVVVGCGNSGTNYLDGDMALFGLSAKALTDTQIWNMFSQSRPLFM